MQIIILEKLLNFSENASGMNQPQWFVKSVAQRNGTLVSLGDLYLNL